MIGTGTRAGASVTVNFPASWAGTTVQVWGFVCTRVEEPTLISEYGLRLKPYECSRSEYIGEGEVGG